MTDFDALIPELPTWNSGRGIDIESWVGCTGTFQLAIGYSTLFWPRFVEHDGMIFREGFSIESVKSCMAANDGDKSATEDLLNHLHIIDLHYVGCPDASRERIVYLGNLLKKIYECKLKAQFPKREIVVEFDDSHKEDIREYQLSFYQRRDS